MHKYRAELIAFLITLKWIPESKPIHFYFLYMFIISRMIDLSSILSLCILVFIVSNGVVIADIRLPAIKGGKTFNLQKCCWTWSLFIVLYSSPATRFLMNYRLDQYKPEKVKSLTSDTFRPCILSIDFACIELLYLTLIDSSGSIRADTKVLDTKEPARVA
jgi:hypothetical protein